jgi:CRP/FNR family cyclic AMP-dependent transcriptional regulator
METRRQGTQDAGTIDDADRQALQSHALFGGLGREQLDLVVPLMQVERFASAQDIVREREIGDRLYFILEGSVEILKASEDPNRVPDRRLAVLGAGDTFGEMELLDIQPRSATVRALVDTRTLTLSNRALLQISRKNMEVFCLLLMNMARETSRRLRRMNALIASSVFSAGAGESGEASNREPSGEKP